MSRVLALRAPRGKLLRRRRPLRAEETARVLPLAVPVAAAGAAGIGAAAATLVAEPPGTAALLGAVGLLAASVVAEAFPLPIEGVKIGAMSLATVFIVAAAALYGWPSAAVVAFLTMVGVEIAIRRPPLRVVYNSALYVCAAIAAGVTAEAVGSDDLLSLTTGAFLAATAFYVVDIVLLAAVISRAREHRLASSLRALASSTSGPFLIMASLTVTLVVLWDRSPFVSIVLVAPLLTIAFYQRWLHGALERLREFDRMKDEFIAVISHELRTPLTSVYGAAVTLQQQEVAPRDRDALLGIVSSEAGRLARLLDDVLWASRLDTGREETVIAPTDAVAVADDVVSAARSRAPDGLRIDFVAHDALPPAAADPDKLRQVLVNLVENAIKYSPDGGEVSVEVARAGRNVRVNVRDEGIGIPASEQGRIFEKFHRLDPNMTRGVSGSGLGLYICRELVERMYGRIWVTSEEGRGSTFTFELPLERGA